MTTTGFDVMRKGGNWLGTAREFLQTHAIRGDSLTWGSYEEVRGLTVRDVEEMVADAVAADRNERSAR